MLEVQLSKRLEDYPLDIAFKADPGITAIFGPSGAGKSMLAKMLGGLEKPDHGLIRLNGKDLYKREEGNLRRTSLPPQKRHIGFVFQEHRLFPHYTVLGNLKYGMNGKTINRPAPDIKEVIRFLGVESLLHRRPGSLSGGERQRIAIGRALLSAPDILIMDEPLSNLDEARKAEVITLIEKLRDQFDQSILYISHSMTEVMRLANTVLLLDKGQVLACGPTARTLSRHDFYPYTGGVDAGTVLDATVLGHEDGFNLSRLETGIGILTLPKMATTDVGDTIRLHIRARDIALAVEDINHISILNRFNGIISKITPSGPGMVDVSIHIGQMLTARITEKSLQQLGLQEGSSVWALIKSVTVNAMEYHQT